MAEYFHDFLSRHDLFNISVQAPQILLLGDEIPAAQPRQLPGGQQHNAYHRQSDECQRDIQRQHADKYTDNRKRAGYQLRDTLTEHLPQRINIIRVYRHDIAGSVASVKL